MGVAVVVCHGIGGWIACVSNRLLRLWLCGLN